MVTKACNFKRKHYDFLNMYLTNYEAFQAKIRWYTVAKQKWSCHHPPSPERCRGGAGESDETSRIFCGLVNFPEMNWVISVYGGTMSDNHKLFLFWGI